MDDSGFLTTQDVAQQAGDSLALQQARAQALMAQAAALRKQDPQHHTTGAGGFFGALGDVAGAYFGAKKEKEATALQQKIADTDKAERQQAMGLLGGDDLLDSDLPPQEKQMALANALRGKTRQAQQLQLSGNPTLVAFGKEQEARLQHQGDLLAAMPERLAKAKALEEDNAPPDANTAAVLKAKFGFDASMLPMRQVKTIVGLIQSGLTAEARQAYQNGLLGLKGSEVVLGPDGRPVMKHAGHGGGANQQPQGSTSPSAAPNAGGASPAGPEQEPLEPIAGSQASKALNKRWMDLDSLLNPNKRGSGELGKNQGRVNAAQRLKALIYQPGSVDVRDLDPREIQELAIGMQNMLSSGGHSVGEVEHLVPHTGTLTGAKVVEWLTSNPQGAGLQAFAEKMGHTVDREEQTALKSLHDAQYAALPQFTDIAKYKKKFGAALSARGLDPASLDENLLQKKAAGATGGGKTVVRKQQNRGLGKTRVTYSDGTTEELNGLQ